jgi:hypothetical protein
LHEHLTEALVKSTFEELREGERERVLTLQRMVAFWAAVILRAPASLSQALREASMDGSSSYPQVGVSKQAFFSRCADLSWEFFAGVFHSFVKSVASTEPPRFAAHQREVAERFGHILVVDGSNLDPVARRLKILWADTTTPIPGSVLACYDLMRGTVAELLFTPTLRDGELRLARDVFGRLPSGSLLLGDRLYETPQILSEVDAKGVYAVFRRAKWATVKEVKHLSTSTYEDATLDDYEVTTRRTNPVRARLIRLTKEEKTYEFITNVLDPERLSASEIVDLYEDRWSVERMFFDLKEVLNLHCFYCGNTNAVAMQVYAAAIVYTAMRVAQGRIAASVSVEPEALSEAKLFPLLAATSAVLAVLELGFGLTLEANPGVSLKKPDWRAACRTTVALEQILADKTRGNRRRQETPPAKKRGWREMPPPASQPKAPPLS